VSAEDHFRDRVRSLAQSLTDQKVDYRELDFQPVISKGFWSRKEPQVDCEGVIRGKVVELEDLGTQRMSRMRAEKPELKL